MPITISEAANATAQTARTKVESLDHPARFVLSAGLAGMFVGFAVVLLLGVGGPLHEAGSPLTALVSGSVFGIALVLVVFAGGELATGSAMVMAHGVVGRTVKARPAVAVLALTLAGNAVGSLALALMVDGSGTFTAGARLELLADMAAAKHAVAGPQLFWRAVLCNALVCLALWMATRATSDTARLITLWWGVLAFIASGFEHSVANMTALSLAALTGVGDWSMLLRNLAWTVPGNLVGGAVVVGCAYGVLGAGAGATRRGTVGHANPLPTSAHTAA